MSTRKINVYDFDHTIYDGDASMDFIAYCLKRSPRLWKYLPSQAFVLGLYVLRLRTRKQVKQVAFAFLKDINDTDEIVASFWRDHEHKIKAWYLEQKQAGDLIVSASPEFLLTPIMKKLGVSRLIATVMDPQTGKIAGKNCRAAEKVSRLHQYDPSLSINECYSDSMSDLPLLKLADKPYIVKKHTITALQDYKLKG